MAFATLAANLRLNISDFSTNLTRASERMTRFAGQLNRDYGMANTALGKHNLGLKDTARIMQGIVVAQTFYRVVNAIQEATNALWEFNKQLDYANVTYSALFGDTKLASDFMSVLQEHAIETIFDYQDLAGISKKLLAYGIEYKNLMFVMEGLTNLGAMSGDPAALDRIALALGQIYTKGKLSAEEMRQLANAYVPITEIITEKFNLSEDDLKSVGDLNLPAEEVINAIVDYANERFGSVGDAAMYTITGLQAKIVDTLKTVGSEMTQPLMAGYKSFLVYISSGLEGIRESFAAGGLGGVFEYLVPDEGTQKTLRIFFANIKNLFMSVMSLVKAAGQVLGNFAQVFVATFNAVVPAITAVINVLSIVINAMASTSTGAAILRVALVAVAGAFVLMRVQAIGALIVTVVTKAVNALSKALVVLATVISKHPILSLLAMLGVALVGVTVSSDSANKALSGFFDTLASAGGSSSGDILQKTDKDIEKAEDALKQFNNRLGDAVDGSEDLKDGINDAGKEAKKTSGLLSFDEVFKLPDKSESGSGNHHYDGIAGDLEGIIDGLGSLSSALIPDIPDFSEYLNDFNNSLLGGLSDDLKDKISAGGWGSLIGGILGALIGTAFGNPILGAKIGMAAGALVGVIFDELEYAVSNVGVGAFTGIWKTIASGLAKSGAASLGAIVTNAFKTGGLKGVWTALANVIKNTGVKSLVKGGLIGAAIGLVVDGVAHLLWSTMEEKFSTANAETAKVGQTIGSLIGTIIGGLLGGPAGALIGSAIGTFAGGLVGLFWDEIVAGIKNNFSILDGWISAAANSVTEWWNGTELGSGLNQWFVDTKAGFSTWWSDTKLGFTTWWSETKSGFTTWFTDTKAGLATWWSETKNSYDTWLSETKSGFSTWWSDTKSGFSTWWSETKLGFSTWWSETVDIFSDWDSITSETLGDWWKDTKDKFSTWWSDTKSGFSDWARDTLGINTTWWNDTRSGIIKWSSDTFASVLGWAKDTIGQFSSWFKNTVKIFTDWAESAGNKIKGWAEKAYLIISDWSDDVVKAIKGWALDTAKDIGGWVSDRLKALKGWATDSGLVIGGFTIASKKSIGQWITDTAADFGSWVSGNLKTLGEWSTRAGDIWDAMWDPKNWKSGWESVSTWFSDLWSGIYGWFTNLGKSVSNWWNGLWDDKKANVNISAGSNPSVTLGGHATGGIFNREHIARFAENNKAEAIIPLENNRAMQPFVDAVSNGIISSLAPIVATVNAGGGNGLPPMYVGTLVADERGLRELYKRFEVIQVQEDARRGIVREAL